MESSSAILSPAAMEIIPGSVGGVLQVLAGQPFDIVKVRVQNSTRRENAYRVFQDIIRTEGPRSLYKGTLSPLASVPMMVALQFSFNGATKRNFVQQNRKDGVENPYSLSLTQYLLSGLSSGVGLAHLSTPIEHIRIRCQMQKGTAA